MRRPATSIPAMRAAPSLGVKYPVRIFKVVDLPAPLGPKKAATCPRATENDTSRIAAKLP